MTRREDPVLRHARREAIVIAVAWAVVTVVACLVSYWLGYIRPGRPLGRDDVRPIPVPMLGMPTWFFWGVIVPWIGSTAFIFWFAGFAMADDDLGSDHAAELEQDIREGGLEP